MGKNFYSVEEAKTFAINRLPKLVFDFVDGSSGNETLPELNNLELQKIRLIPRV